MKTNIYLVIILSFGLGVHLIAQTTINKTDRANTESQTSATPKNKKILSRLGGKSVPNKLNVEHPVAVKSANISGESERSDLLKLAEALSYQSRRLKNEAAGKTGSEKEKLLNQAAQYEKNCLLKQIEASEISGSISQIQFSSNKETIKRLLASIKLEVAKISRIKQLISSAERNMQRAKCLRDEAYTRNSLVAKLGSMSNAEEKEVMALGDQTKAIDLIGKKPRGGI